ncbi:hypothetical protein [Phenylobacterium sp.]|nr:hypothetical protein [Phenylobacterium sp.]MDP1872851.1 hypothetical protein [Phenylobacterium sp.]MDP3490187.1 hypothetical protein [Phenylobacterium sp.]
MPQGEEVCGKWSDQGGERLKAGQDAPEGEGRSDGDGEDQADPRARA